MPALGQKQTPRHVRGVRFTPDSGHSSAQVDVRCVPQADSPRAIENCLCSQEGASRVSGVLW